MLKLDKGAGVAVEVKRDDGATDLIAYNPTGGLTTIAGPRIRTRAHIALGTYDSHATLTRWFRAFSTRNDEQFDAYQPESGEVTELFPLHSAVAVVFNGDASPTDAQSLVGRVVFFRNDRHRVAHTVSSAVRDFDNPLKYTLTLTDDILVGIARLDRVEPTFLSTSTALPLSPTYRGTTLAADLFRLTRPVEGVIDGKLELSQPMPPNNPLKPGDNVWLLNVGVGDTIEVPTVRYKEELGQSAPAVGYNPATTKGAP